MINKKLVITFLVPGIDVHFEDGSSHSDNELKMLEENLAYEIESGVRSFKKEIDKHFISIYKNKEATMSPILSTEMNIRIVEIILNCGWEVLNPDIKLELSSDGFPTLNYDITYFDSEDVYYSLDNNGKIVYDIIHDSDVEEMTTDDLENNE